ncbi:MAG: hypothetical protein ABSD74_09720 [Rhizomicrobium sp.]
MTKFLKIFAACVAVSTLAACATWSTGHVTPASTGGSAQSQAAPTSADSIVVTENDINNRPYTVLGDIKVTVNKTTIFNKDPTHDDINAALREKAAKLGADAVVLVRYGTVGVGFMSWGELDGQGRAVKFN